MYFYAWATQMEFHQTSHPQITPQLRSIKTHPSGNSLECVCSTIFPHRLLVPYYPTGRFCDSLLLPQLDFIDENDIVRPMKWVSLQSLKVVFRMGGGVQHSIKFARKVWGSLQGSSVKKTCCIARTNVPCPLALLGNSIWLEINGCISIFPFPNSRTFCRKDGWGGEQCPL